MPLTKEQINEEYSSDKPFAYGGKYRLYNFYKNKKLVDEAMKENEIYSRYKTRRKSKIFSPIYVYSKRELFQSDVIFFKDEKEYNNGYAYLFTTIDCFTKYAWVYPMKENKCETVKKCFEDILRKCGKKPERLNTDRGSEMKCRAFQTLLKNAKIHHYFSYSDRKCPIIERFNHTLERKLYKAMADNRTFEWTRLIESVMKSYLNGKHRTIKMSPVEAEKEENQKTLLQTYHEKYQKAGLKKVKPKFKVGDTVRIYRSRHAFHRAYDEDFSREIFTVTEVHTNLPVPRYTLKDYSGETIVGKFFNDELVDFKQNSEFWESEVIAERKNPRTKRKQVKIHYVGWPSKYDEWKDERDVVDL